MWVFFYFFFMHLPLREIDRERDVWNTVYWPSIVMQELLLLLLQNMEQKKIKVSKCKIESSRDLRIFSWQTFYSLLVRLCVFCFWLFFPFSLPDLKKKNFNLLFCFIVFIAHKLFPVFRRCVSGSWLFFHFSLLHVWRSPSWRVEPHLFSSDWISSVLITPFKTALIIIIKTVFIIVFWSNQISVFLSMLSISCTSNEQ